MFTGLIEEIGTVHLVESASAGSRIVIHAQTVLEEVRLGDSIAIDGVCTTVIKFDSGSFTIEATPETLSKTKFGDFTPGRRVNLERPLLPTTRLGGHFVTGHVDGLAEIVQIIEQGNSQVFRFRLLNPDHRCLMVEKGSVAVNGISLTVNTVIGDTFSVAIIPHTLAHTNIGDHRSVDTVHIETDILGKYVQRMMVAEENPLTTPLTPKKTRIFSGTWFCHDDE